MTFIPQKAENVGGGYADQYQSAAQGASGRRLPFDNAELSQPTATVPLQDSCSRAPAPLPAGMGRNAPGHSSGGAYTRASDSYARSLAGSDYSDGRHRAYSTRGVDSQARTSNTISAHQPIVAPPARRRSAHSRAVGRPQ